MAGKFNYELRNKYPHLIGEDTAVWERFVLKFPDRFNTVDYDVHVGSGIEPLDGIESNIVDQWRDLTRKRIDVIGWNRDFATIIEVKKRVGLPALGQILGYRFLYRREHSGIFLKPPLIICGQIAQDDIDVLDYFGILHEAV
ncbi:MAG: hypothetical protein GH151_06640 [Bacteroidetes bacterium]|nr:hypothetical protein [Bacteroidota bacterium]